MLTELELCRKREHKAATRREYLDARSVRMRHQSAEKKPVKAYTVPLDMHPAHPTSQKPVKGRVLDFVRGVATRMFGRGR